MSLTSTILSSPGFESLAAATAALTSSGPIRRRCCSPFFSFGLASTLASTLPTPYKFPYKRKHGDLVGESVSGAVWGLFPGKKSSKVNGGTLARLGNGNHNPGVGGSSPSPATIDKVHWAPRPRWGMGFG